jgi:hypothetical protein
VKGGLLLDVVVTQSAAILELLSSKDKTLLIRGDSFLVLDLSLDIIDSVAGLDIESDGLSGESFYENLRRNVVQKLREKAGLDDDSERSRNRWASLLPSMGC